jgi:hypothetical protein
VRKRRYHAHEFQKRFALKMSRRTTKFVIFVLLIAAAAFVLDVLSPLTPTPNAIGARLLVTLQFLLALILVYGPVISVARESWLQRHWIAAPPIARRTLIVLICALLC